MNSRSTAERPLLVSNESQCNAPHLFNTTWHSKDSALSNTCTNRSCLYCQTAHTNSSHSYVLYYIVLIIAHHIAILDKVCICFESSFWNHVLIMFDNLWMCKSIWERDNVKAWKYSTKRVRSVHVCAKGVNFCSEVLTLRKTASCL